MNDNSDIIYDISEDYDEYDRKISRFFKDKYLLPQGITVKENFVQIESLDVISKHGNNYPFISYFSIVDKGDTNKLKLENQHVHKHVKKMFDGISSISDSIFYNINLATGKLQLSQGM